MAKFKGKFVTPTGDHVEFRLEIFEKLENKEKFEKELQKVMKPLLYSHYLDLLLREVDFDDILKVYNNGDEVPREELERILWKIDKPLYTCISLVNVKNISCQGCREDLPNQKAHMDYGGCLYEESSDSD